MKVRLIFPPHFAYQQPYLSLPALAGALEKSGVEVIQEDLNIDLFHQLSAVPYLQECGERIREDIRALEGSGKVLSTDPEYRAKRRALLLLDVVGGEVDDAKEFFSLGTNFFDFTAYQTAERILDAVLEIVSATYYPTRLSLVDLAMPYSAESSEEILLGIENARTNPFLEPLERWARKAAAKDVPDLMGISITALTQMLPAFTAARCIRRFMPTTQIVLGGVIVNHLFEKLARCKSLQPFWNFAIRYEGETALTQLCQAVESGSGFGKVPNLMYKDHDSIVVNEAFQLENLTTLPTPSYKGVDLSSYLSPAPVLSLEPARGCYWRKCTFCNQYSVHRESFRVRPPEKVVDDMEVLQEKHGVRIFNVVNEGMPAKQLFYLASEINERGLDVGWYAGARLEPYLDAVRLKELALSGCRKLFFGLESGSQRLLDLMGKGIEVEHVERIVRDCEKAGVDPHLYLMIGFPTETPDEREGTLELAKKLLRSLRSSWATAYFSVFQPMIASPFLEQAQHLGEGIQVKGEEFDLEYLFEIGGGELRDIVRKRKDLDHEAAKMSAVLRESLPVRGFPQEVTHYMLYRDNADANGHESEADQRLLRRNQHAVGGPIELEQPRKSTSGRDGSHPRNSKISLRRFVGVGNTGPLNGAHPGATVAYDMMRDEGFRLDKLMARVAQAARWPKTVEEIGQELGIPIEEAGRAIRRLEAEGLVVVENV